MPSVIRRIVPSVEPGPPPNRGGRPVTCRTADATAFTRGSLRATRVASLTPLTGSHSTVAPGQRRIARRQALSISAATVAPSGPGVRRTSSVRRALDGITLDCPIPCAGAWSTVGVTVGGPRYLLVSDRRPEPPLERRDLGEERADGRDRVHA